MHIRNHAEKKNRAPSVQWRSSFREESVINTLQHAGGSQGKNAFVAHREVR